MRVGPNTRLPILRLAALTVVAFFLHGYHLGVEDAEIYLPAVKKIAHRSLFIHMLRNSSLLTDIYRCSVHSLRERPY